MFFKQTLRDIILVFHYVLESGMNLQEWKVVCRIAWEINYDILELDRFAKIGECRYTFKTWNKTIYTECTPVTKPF